MKPTLRIILSMVMLATSLAACGYPAQTSTPEPYAARPTIVWPSATPSPTITLTPTPLPTSTPTSTPLATDTPVASPTLTPTALPLDMQMRIFEDMWSVVNENYVYPDFNGVDWEAVRVEFRQRISAGLDNAGFYNTMYEMIYRLGDEHSFYLSPQEVAEDEAHYAGQHDYVGIGVLHQPIPERKLTVILAVFPGSPAEAAGLQPRDAILAVEGVPIIDEDGILRDTVRGPAGTPVTLTVRTPGQAERQVTIIRQRITGSVSVPYQVLTSPAGLRIGYIFLFGFDDSTIDERVADNLQVMTAEGPLDGLIIDNRMNGGGASTVVEPILGYFTGGTLGYYVYQNEQRPFRVSSTDINGSQDIPLVVLVGSGSASFGEIFAGVLQDSGRAHIIGTITDGNVEVLWGYNFDDGSELWLASETFRPYLHPELDWEASGIIPDEIVAGDFDQSTLENDPPVLAALAYFESLP